MPMYKRSMFVLLAMAAAIFAGMIYGYQGKDPAAALDPAEKQEADAPTIAVYVTGAINKPGVVKLAAGSRVIDAVNLCGGVLPTADVDKVNMAQPLKDGAQVSVPAKPAAGTGSQDGRSPAAAQGDGKVNINTADVKAFDSLPGIGPALAQRIIDYRAAEGSFQTLEDLKKVRGIGEEKFAKMKDKITL